jgi:hypothetical protein
LPEDGIGAILLTMKKKSSRAGIALRRTLAIVLSCFILVAFPVAAVEVGGVDLNARDLGGGEEGDEGMIIVTGGSSLIAIEVDHVLTDLGGGGDDDDDEDPPTTVGNTGFSSSLSSPSEALGQNTQIQPPGGGVSQATSGLNGQEPVSLYSLVERRPDFEYRAGSLEFDPVLTYTTGQKCMGIGPGLSSSRTQYLPLGEF